MFWNRTYGQRITFQMLTDANVLPKTKVQDIPIGDGVSSRSKDTVRNSLTHNYSLVEEDVVYERNLQTLSEITRL
jgi:hypothetical protein